MIDSEVYTYEKLTDTIVADPAETKTWQPSASGLCKKLRPPFRGKNKTLLVFGSRTLGDSLAFHTSFFCLFGTI